MQPAALLLRKVRREVGVTQAEVARRLGVSQGAVAKLERLDANPTIATLDNALQSLGSRLVLSTKPKRGIDETLVAQQLRLTPQQRLEQLERMYEVGRSLARAGARARGELD
jgi:transcriptional regulator with XRE-family HTH domain